MWTVIPSPIGDLRVVTTPDGQAIRAIEFSPFKGSPIGEPIGERSDEQPVLAAAASQLAEYFAKQRRVFDLPLQTKGTDFQQKVWAQLQQIDFGETCSYGQLAKRLGMTQAASRAVGLANGRNPIPVVIPCHRVIGADGSLTGYAGGVERKQILLELEEQALF